MTSRVGTWREVVSPAANTEFNEVGRVERHGNPLKDAKTEALRRCAEC